MDVVVEPRPISAVRTLSAAFWRWVLRDQTAGQMTPKNNDVTSTSPGAAEMTAIVTLP
ncbi:hypothetical protein [Kitasatospora purpeofusca]|uniref:hypothetical protein n=1 Tax=Kitasatospora purpeofusca TaxID=67352 RepID=UPI00386E1F9C|nr:hypothetical protein OIP63_25515 [Kitasatospora purpeofusca]